MGKGYATAYRAGIIPWEKAGRTDRPTLDRLLDREETDRPGSTNRALDLGCGRGAHTKLLVDRGWDAIGVDDVRQAIDVAVRRNELEDARFVVGDVRHLVHCGVGSGFDLFLDVGCFQSLDDEGRMSMAEGVTELAEPGATVLVHTGGPRAWPTRSREATRDDLARAYEGWTVSAVEPERPSAQVSPTEGSPTGRPATDAPEGSAANARHPSHWFRLTR